MEMLDASYITFEHIIDINNGLQLEYFRVLKEVFNGRERWKKELDRAPVI